MSPAEMLVNEVAGEGRSTMEKRDEADRDARGPLRVKRPYEPPMIWSVEIFETTALAFGTITRLRSLANPSPKAS